MSSGMSGKDEFARARAKLLRKFPHVSKSAIAFLCGRSTHKVELLYLLLERTR